ncbi:TIGR02234 family membrane protein [Skermania sp. ID1734]|uniref:TIGR02234 family membrane protein n=1 Tax=Skermania sp. ID1734 TaxID=2597516 RepID=UPI00117CD97C|nr:TIGR02234 family membrane protein [Skermania sp. ID1734]TSD98155.1 TIGR02234 family membrane protein [Skermania sp. ID1734]
MIPRRRYPVFCAILLVLAAAALWGSAQLDWVRVASADGLGKPRTTDLNGTVWVSILTPLALVFIAAIAAVFALKGWARRVLGVVVATVAAIAAVPALASLFTSLSAVRAKQLADLPARATVTSVQAHPLPAVLVLVGAVIAFAAGMLLVRKPLPDAGLSAKYANPATRRAAAVRATSMQERSPRERVAPDRTGDRTPPSERTLWDAIDAGEDPTIGPDTDPDTRI